MSSAFAAPRGAGPQQSALLWLAVRLSLNVRGAAAACLLRLSVGTVLATLPLTVLLAAGLADALPGKTALGLVLATCPGAAVSLWAAHSVAADRAATAEALRQVGAERAVSWLLPAVRVALATGLGALVGTAALAILRGAVFRGLPKESPLYRAVTAVSSGGWILAAIGVTALLTVCALFTSGAGHRLAGRLRRRLAPRAAAVTERSRDRLKAR